MKHQRISLIGQYLKSNLKSAAEYRAAFFIQVFGMILNNASFIVFWAVLFHRSESIAGYSFQNVMFLWTLASTGFGLAAVFLGNWLHLSRIIYNGELDVYILQPRNIPLNLLSSRMNISGWGDILFGIGLFFATQPLGLVSVILYIYLSILTGLGLAAINTAYHSLSFFLGRAEEIADLGLNGLLSFMTYPPGLFQGALKWVLMTLLPAFWISYIPEELFRSFSWQKFVFITLTDIILIGCCIGFFYLGLKKYESGNRMGTRL